MLSKDQIVTSLKHENNQVSIHPNPINEYLMVQQKSADILDFTITDLLGKVVIDGAISQYGKIDVSTLLPGSYLITFEGLNRVQQSVRLLKN